jgi:hypothetical protein
MQLLVKCMLHGVRSLPRSWCMQLASVTHSLCRYLVAFAAVA